MYFQGKLIASLNQDNHDQNVNSDSCVSKFTKAVRFKFELSRAEAGRLFRKGPDNKYFTFTRLMSLSVSQPRPWKWMSVAVFQ